MVFCSQRHRRKRRKHVSHIYNSRKNRLIGTGNVAMLSGAFLKRMNVVHEEPVASLSPSLRALVSRRRCQENESIHHSR